MGQLVPITAVPRRKPATPHPMPEHFSLQQCERLYKRAQAWGFTVHELYFAVTSVRDWHASRGCMRKDWVAVIINGMRQGWALRGFKQWQARRGLSNRGKDITSLWIDTKMKELQDLGRT